jgi:hypothetical protein
MITSKKKLIQKESFLVPQEEPIVVNGKMFYSEGEQSWNVLRLKNEVLKEFPQLKEKREKFGYTLLISKTKNDVKKVLAEVEKTGAIPILLFFNKENQDG